MRVVLNVDVSDVALNGLARLRFVEHEFIERSRR
jgi:hypothetical protein